jgi:Uma2 family endonuclease
MLMTPEEFDRETDFDELYSYELIHGVLIVSPPPGESERDPNDELAYLFRNHQLNHDQGKRIDKTLNEQYIAVPNGRRRADRVVWVGLGPVPDPRVDVPTIAIEFVSERLRDRVCDYEEKRQDYREAGVQEYWIIDRFQRIMTVFRKSADGIEQVVLQEHEVYRTPLLPGFELPLARIMTLADDWSKKPRQSRSKGQAAGPDG